MWGRHREVPALRAPVSELSVILSDYLAQANALALECRALLDGLDPATRLDVAKGQLNALKDDRLAALQTALRALPAEDRRAVLSLFMRECETNARLRHPNIVAFLGLIADDSGPRYLMLEHMAGGTLHDLVHSSGELGTQRLHGILLDVCKALHYLHSLRPAVLHLDVKPKNVLLDGDRAKLADLGEAHIVRNTATITARRGTVGVHGVGTLDYMAPEVRRVAGHFTL